MKITVGHKLHKIREERKLSQADMAEMLSISAATYSRLERNETSVELENLVSLSKKLNIPIQEFLPETLSINNNTENGQGQVIFGNNYYYANSQIHQELTDEIKELKKEIEAMKEFLKL